DGGEEGRHEGDRLARAPLHALDCSSTRCARDRDAHRTDRCYEPPMPRPLTPSLLTFALVIALTGVACKGRFKPIPPGRFTEQVALSGRGGCARMKDASVRCFGAGGARVMRGLEGSAQVVATASGACG